MWTLATSSNQRLCSPIPCSRNAAARISTSAIAIRSPTPRRWADVMLRYSEASALLVDRCQILRGVPLRMTIPTSDFDEHLTHVHHQQNEPQHEDQEHRVDQVHVLRNGQHVTDVRMH